MSRMLASVNCLQEAQMIAALGDVIIDLKQPETGALGALPIDEVTRIVAHLSPDSTVSATIGDLPLRADVVVPAVLTMASSGVDFVKIGFFGDGDPKAVLSALKPHSQNIALIAVLFADQAPDFELLPQLAAHGFRGVMLDTQHKQHGRLPDLMDKHQLAEFVDTAKQLGLLCGLAGSLRLQDIVQLQPLDADYLGFRGGLCSDYQRTNRIDPERASTIFQALQTPVQPLQILTA